MNDPQVLNNFSRIDDFDIFTAIKVWADNEDRVLSTLCRSLSNRVLYRIEMQNKPFDRARVETIKDRVLKEMSIPSSQVDYFVFTDSTSSYAYDPLDESIEILHKNGQVMDFATACEEFDLTVLTKPVVKHILGYPKNLGPVEN